MNPAALFAACVLIWGTTWYAITFQLAGAAPDVGVAIRFSLAAVMLIVWCLWRRIAVSFSWREHAWIALLGGFNFTLTYVLVYYAERLIVSGLVAVGYSAMPLVNMTLARMFFGTPMSRRVAVAGVCGVIGITLVFWPDFGRVEANTALLLGAASRSSSRGRRHSCSRCCICRSSARRSRSAPTLRCLRASVPRAPRMSASWQPCSR
ncbi:MAG: DMT family transporter [Burkholderiaceae bacterium]